MRTDKSRLPYLFGTLEVAYGVAVTAKDRAMADISTGYIAAFAKTGDPNRRGLPTSPRYDPAKSELMMLTADTAGTIQADPWQSRLDLIEHADVYALIWSPQD
jgi:para-nitrobenzyl esterase